MENSTRPSCLQRNHRATLSTVSAPICMPVRGWCSLVWKCPVNIFSDPSQWNKSSPFGLSFISHWIYMASAQCWAMPILGLSRGQWNRSWTDSRVWSVGKSFPSQGKQKTKMPLAKRMTMLPAKIPKIYLMIFSLVMESIKILLIEIIELLEYR